MEVLAVTASIAGIVGLGIQIAQILQKQIGDVQDADDRLLQIVYEIGATTTSLQNLHELLRKDEDNPNEQLLSQQCRNDVMNILHRCNVVFRNLTVLLAKAGKSVLAVVDDFQLKTGKLKSLKDKGPILEIELSSIEHLMWPWRLPKLEQYIADLDKLKLSLLLILSVAALAQKTISPYDSDASTLYDDEEDARLVAEVYYRNEEYEEAERWGTETTTVTPAAYQKFTAQSTPQAAQMLVQNWPHLPDGGGYPSAMDLQKLGVDLEAFAMMLPRFGDLETKSRWFKMPMTVGVIQDHILHDLNKAKPLKSIWFTFTRLPRYQQVAILDFLNDLPSANGNSPTLINIDIYKHRRQRLIERWKDLTSFSGCSVPRSDIILVVAWIRQLPEADIDPFVSLGPRPLADRVLKRPILSSGVHRSGRSRSRERLRPSDYSHEQYDQQKKFSSRVFEKSNSLKPDPRGSDDNRELMTLRVGNEYEKERPARREERRERPRPRDYGQAADLIPETNKDEPLRIGFRDVTAAGSERADPTSTGTYQDEPRRVPSFRRRLSDETEDDSQHRHYDGEPELERRQTDRDEPETTIQADIRRSGMPIQDRYRHHGEYDSRYERRESRYDPQAMVNNDPTSTSFPEGHRVRYASSIPHTFAIPYYHDEQDNQPYYSHADWQLERIPARANRERYTTQPRVPRTNTLGSNRPEPGLLRPRRIDDEMELLRRRATSEPRNYERDYSYPYPQDRWGVSHRGATFEPRNYGRDAYSSYSYPHPPAPEDPYPSRRPTTYQYPPRRSTTYNDQSHARMMTRGETHARAYDNSFPPSEEDKMSVAQYYIMRWTTAVSQMRQKLSSRRGRHHNDDQVRPEPFPMRPRPADRGASPFSRERRAESEDEKAQVDTKESEDT